MRLKVSDLLVGKQYAIQVRAVAGDEVSEWSPRFKFVTIRDDTQPKVPQNVTWVVSGDSYMAEWDSVTEDVQNRPVSILRYNVRLRAGAMEEILPASAAAETPSGRQRWDLLRQQAVNMFGGVESKTIEFSVRAVIEGPDGPIKSDWSTPITVGHEAPEPPTNGVAKGILDGIVLTWSPSPSSDVVGYRIYVGPDAAFVPSNANMASNDPDWVWEEGVDENYIQGNEYTYYTSTYADHYFKIRAVNSYNMESTDLLVVGAPISPFVYDTDPPAMPTGLAVTRDATDKTTATATWGPVEEDESRAGFNVMYITHAKYLAIANPLTDPWVGAQMVDAAPDQTSLVISKLDPYTQYHFRIRAFDTYANYSEWSAEANLAAENNPIPSAVQGVTVTASNVDPTLYIKWTPHTDTDIKTYQVQVDRVNTFDGPFLRNYYTPSDSQTVENLVAGLTYYVRVRAIDTANQNGTWSSTASIAANEFNPTDGNAPASAPVVTVGTTLPGGAIHVFWPAVANNDPVTYEVHVSATTGFTPGAGTLFEETSSTSSVITGKPYGTTQYIKVIPKDDDGVGPTSTQVSATPVKVADTDVISLGVGKLTTGTINSATITIDTGGVIKSLNYNATTKTGWQISDAGITLYNGVVSASALTAGTISGTTVNIGTGGVLNVDSTAIVKSNNYAAGTAGWKLDSAGLEINSGSISANLITGGTLDAGIIYVSSGGSIQDANGYWSITPSSINIQSGSINAAAITSGVLRSNAYAKNADGSTNYSYWAWQIDKDGDAVFGSVYVRGRVIVDSGVMQSSYYYPGSSGWRIDSGGSVYFNQAEVNAGTFKTQASGSRLELGYSGGYATDQVRMFNGSSVSSIRNVDNRPGTVYMSFSENSGGQMTFGTAPDGNVYIQGYLSTPRLKFTSGYVQVRDQYDSGYADFNAGTITATSNLTVSNDATVNGFLVVPSLNSATGGTANVNWNSANGRLRLISSSRRFKENITPLTLDTQKVLELEPKIFQRNDEYDADDNLLPVTKDSPWHAGFIAEDAKELGLNQFTYDDSDGNTLGFTYDLWVVAQQAVLREHNEKIKTMESRIEALEKLLNERS